MMYFPFELDVMYLTLLPYMDNLSLFSHVLC